MEKREVVSFGFGLWLKADKKAAVVYVNGEPSITYYRMNGGLNWKRVCVDLVSRFSLWEPYASFDTCKRLARFIAGDKVTCDSV